MSKGVLTTRVSPAYDDVPEEKYHFPRTYLRQVEACVGDWIVYYEPRRSGTRSGGPGGRQSYFAIARVDRVEPDHVLDNHFYAYISDFVGFPQPVPFRSGDTYLELGLQREDGATNKGAFGRSVRLVSELEFETIARLGFADEFALPSSTAAAGASYEIDEPSSHFVRPVIESVIARPFRDIAFRHSVRAAYDNRCAITGLRLINGGGRPEVQAAHIRAVEDNGPDSVRNGLALSGTVHWMFDRGLVSVDENYRLLAPSKLIPDELAPLVRHGAQLHLPTEQSMWPHQTFLAHHRNSRFKG